MPSNTLVVSIVLLLIYSLVINGYRLDNGVNSHESADLHELEDPFLIKRLENLLAQAAVKNTRSALIKDPLLLDGLLLHRLAMARRPGLLRLKRAT